MQAYRPSSYSPYRVMLPPAMLDRNSIRTMGGLRALRGLGQSSTDGLSASQITAVSNSTATIASTVASNEPPSEMAENAAAAALSAAAVVTPPPANVILLAAAGVAKILAALGVGEGCGETCIQATSIVNNAEPSFLANLQQYENGQVTQAQAISTYNSLWQAMVVSCSAISGSAGQDCISDRQEGACHWKATGTPPTPYSPEDGACWNWYLAYYVPLTYPPTNAPAPAPSTTAATSSTGPASGSSSSTSSIFSGNGMFYLLGAGLLALFAFGGDN